MRQHVSVTRPQMWGRCRRQTPEEVYLKPTDPAGAQLRTHREDRCPVSFRGPAESLPDLCERWVVSDCCLLALVLTGQGSEVIGVKLPEDPLRPRGSMSVQ